LHTCCVHLIICYVRVNVKICQTYGFLLYYLFQNSLRIVFLKGNLSGSAKNIKGILSGVCKTWWGAKWSKQVYNPRGFCPRFFVTCVFYYFLAKSTELFNLRVWIKRRFLQINILLWFLFSVLYDIQWIETLFLRCYIWQKWTIECSPSRPRLTKGWVCR